MSKYDENRDEIRKDSYPKGLTCRYGIFRFRKMVNGKKINLAFGKISEREAIQKALKVLYEVEAGLDPVAEASKRKQTFGSVAKKWLQNKRGTDLPYGWWALDE